MTVSLVGKYGAGRAALIDDADACAVGRFQWFVSVQGYPAARINKRTVTLHRFLMGRHGSLHVDHINRNKLDSRRSNLRWVPCAVNTANSGVRRNSSTGFKGVRRAHKGNKWHAQIRIGGRCRFLGAFDTPEQAAKAFATAHSGAYADWMVTHAV